MKTFRKVKEGVKCFESLVSTFTSDQTRSTALNALAGKRSRSEGYGEEDSDDDDDNLGS